MSKSARQTAQQTEDLLAQFDALPVESQAEFALRRGVTMSHALKQVQFLRGPLADSRGSQLRVITGGPYDQIICSLAGQRISNGDILELLLGLPERWLAVWIEGLPKRIYACVLTPYEVSRIELRERSFLRWPLVQDQALKRLATKRLEEIEEARWRS